MMMTIIMAREKGGRPERGSPTPRFLISALFLLPPPPLAAFKIQSENFASNCRIPSWGAGIRRRDPECVCGAAIMRTNVAFNLCRTASCAQIESE